MPRYPNPKNPPCPYCGRPMAKKDRGRYRCDNIDEHPSKEPYLTCVNYEFTPPEPGFYSDKEIPHYAHPKCPECGGYMRKKGYEYPRERDVLYTDEGEPVKIRTYKQPKDPEKAPIRYVCFNRSEHESGRNVQIEVKQDAD